jgi:hypothetical protein
MFSNGSDTSTPAQLVVASDASVVRVLKRRLDTDDRYYCRKQSEVYAGANVCAKMHGSQVAANRAFSNVCKQGFHCVLPTLLGL